MLELRGKYNTAKVYTDNLDSAAISQIIELCNQEIFNGSKIRMMPDVHYGTSCTIGATMTIKDKIVPNLVGGDLFCGVEVAKLKQKEVDFGLLDDIIREYIPHDYKIREKKHRYVNKINFEDLKCREILDMNRIELSLGTPGGGNHFIEVDKDFDSGELYLVVHSGSRYLGSQVAKFYQKLAYKSLTTTSHIKKEIINNLKAQGREKEIQAELNKIKTPKINKLYAYLEGENLKKYINDIKITQLYAEYNRKAIIDDIISHMKLDKVEQFTTVHNYIDLDNMILRKGAISAQKGEIVIIPINMRDGSLICVGKGNPDWNYSAPHGAGRIMSRSKAKEMLDLEEFENSMDEVYTTSVCESTIDESPMAYKPMNEIIKYTKDTIEVKKRIKSVYNFKSKDVKKGGWIDD